MWTLPFPLALLPIRVDVPGNNVVDHVRASDEVGLLKGKSEGDFVAVGSS